MWELIFLMLVMKIPIAYLCWVVYWAVKSRPAPEGGEPAVVSTPLPRPGGEPWRPRRRRRPSRPHGGPTRGYSRTRRAAISRAR